MKIFYLILFVLLLTVPCWAATEDIQPDGNPSPNDFLIDQEIVHRNGTFTNNISNDSITIAKPGGTVEFDLMVCVLAMGFDALKSATAVPTGWTLILSTLAPDNAGRLETFYKIAGGSEPSEYIWDVQEPVAISGGIAVYDFTGTPTVFDVGASANGEGTSIVAPTVNSKATGIVRMRSTCF